MFLFTSLLSSFAVLNFMMKIISLVNAIELVDFDAQFDAKLGQSDTVVSDKILPSNKYSPNVEISVLLNISRIMFPKVLALNASIRNPLGKLTSYEQAFDNYDKTYMRVVMGGRRFDNQAYIIGRSLGGITSRYNLLPLTRCPDSDIDHECSDSQNWQGLEYTLRKFMDKNVENRIQYRILLDYPNEKRVGFPACNRPTYIRLNIRTFNSIELVTEYDVDLENHRCSAELPGTSDSGNGEACICNFRLAPMCKWKKKNLSNS